MDRGIYSATSGGLLESRRLDVVANNLANINTVGFKASRLVTRQQEFSDTLASTIQGSPPRSVGDHERTPGVVDIEAYTDFTPGPVNTTGAPLDVALREPNHFFVVETPDGEQYTRAGNFTANGEGVITTQDGYPVLGEGGPISIQEGSARITSNGSVMVAGESVGKLRVVSVEDPQQLERQGSVRFKASGAAAPAQVPADLIPESVEMPNVSVMEAMVELIATQRAFEGYQKSVLTIGELNEVSLRTSRTG